MDDATLQGYEDTISLLRESLADVQRVLDRDQQGWEQIAGIGTRQSFTHDFRTRRAETLEIAALANPLIKRGIGLRSAYIWGGGVQLAVDDTPDQGQDINAVVQAFLDDIANQATFTSTEAHMGWERSLCLSGEVWLCLPTEPDTGRVRVRQIPFEQITKIVTNPEDEATHWLYLREWTPQGETSPRRAWHPALGYRPATLDQTRDHAGDPVEIRWDAPLRMVAVNQIGGRGLGDIFAAVPWADAYKRFLEDWAKYMASLAKIAWTVTSRGDKAQEIAARMQAAAQAPAGGGLALDPNSRLEAVGKSGATIDADSGRPLATMVAAALDLPVTTLLGDPGVTGARATAETVSADSWAIFDVRRQLWTGVLKDVLGWVIDAAIIAPAGPLRGTTMRDGDRLTTTLPEGDGRTISVDWPQRDDTNLLDRINAVQIAGQSNLLPPLVELRLLLTALGVEDADEILAQVTDDSGNFIPPDVIDAQARQAMRDRGLPA